MWRLEWWVNHLFLGYGVAFYLKRSIFQKLILILCKKYKFLTIVVNLTSFYIMFKLPWNWLGGKAGPISFNLYIMGPLWKFHGTDVITNVSSCRGNHSKSHFFKKLRSILSTLKFVGILQNIWYGCQISPKIQSDYVGHPIFNYNAPSANTDT